MKAKYIILVIALASVFSACNREEKSLFDDQAAVRAQKALDNAFDILTAPANGWEMLYFANPESAGYNVIVTFNENGSVTATAKNKATTANKIQTDSSSTWGVISDYGPILTFDTYNKVLHAWADPQDDGDGLLGDYEFLILHAEPGYVKLKGKKHSAYCYLYQLGTGITATQYFSEIEALNKRLFDNENMFHAQSNGKEYLLYGGSAGIFIRTATGSTVNVETDPTFPVAVRQNGIQLMSPVFDNGGTKFDIQGNELTDGNATIFAAPALTYFSEYLKLLEGRWKIDIKDVNDATKAAITTVNNDLIAAYKNKKACVNGLKYKKEGDHYELVFSYIGSGSKATDMYYIFNITSSGNHVSISYDKPADENAEKVITTFPSIETLFKSLEGSFAVTTSDHLNPTLGSKMIDNANSSIWFNITGTVE